MYALLPDLDSVLVTFLRDHPSLAPLHGGRVGTSLAASVGAALRVTSLGGPDTQPWEGLVDYQVEIWGGTEAQANTLARTVVASVVDLKGPVAGGSVSSAFPSLLPFDSPDAKTGRPRKIMQVTVATHPQ